MTVLVTGAGGQLGRCLKKVSVNFPHISFLFKDYSELDVTNQNSIDEVFNNNSIDYCINCAAYTAVDLAENESNKVFLLNSEAVKYLSKACKEKKVVLIHISTDFVFDGTKTTPYIESDATNPINVYGASKLAGEEQIKSILKRYFIIRTSWLYSEYGSNFLKTMVHLGSEKKQLQIVRDQIGSPTYAMDLANVILHIIESKNQDFGTYHYSNQGKISWYDFAKEIFKLTHSVVKVKAISTSDYPTAAKRPKYSVLSSDKIKEVFRIPIIDWKESLKVAVSKIDH